MLSLADNVLVETSDDPFLSKVTLRPGDGLFLPQPEGRLQPSPRTEAQAGTGLPSILTHQPNGTPRTPKDMAGAAATCEAN